MGLFDRLFGVEKNEPAEEEVEETVASEEVEVEEPEMASVSELHTEEKAESEDLMESQLEEVSEVASEEMTSEVEKVTADTLPDYYVQMRAQLDAASRKVEEEQFQEALEEVRKRRETEAEKYNRSLQKTRSGFLESLNAFFANFRTVDEEFFEELEELLITSDVGVQVATQLTEDLRHEARLENAKKPEDLRRVIIEKLVDIYDKDGHYEEEINFQEGLTVMLFVGVNGVGKTTSIGKLAYRYKEEGRKVMLVAADTFRAGAVAQLVEWGKRVDVPVVTGPEKSDPASVVYDGLERAQAEGVDVLLIDTAGRLQNKDNLMAELEKIGRIIKRVVPDAPHETLLALDASTGQNALVQAKEFSKITPVTGIVLTKIDGTARGGVVLAIRQELDIPVKLIGFGEKLDDIGDFKSEQFMRSLLDGVFVSDID